MHFVRPGETRAAIRVASTSRSFSRPSRQRPIDQASFILPSYLPGQIVRCAFKNFLTYDWAEFFPGPHMNMVIVCRVLESPARSSTLTLSF